MSDLLMISGIIHKIPTRYFTWSGSKEKRNKWDHKFELEPNTTNADCKVVASDPKFNVITNSKRKF